MSRKYSIVEIKMASQMARSLDELRNYCLRIVNNETETRKIEQKEVLNIDDERHKAELIKSISPPLLIPVYRR